MGLTHPRSPCISRGPTHRALKDNPSLLAFWHQVCTSKDSGNPESELTTSTSERASRSPSDYRSIDCDSLSVDDSGDVISEDNIATGATTVIHRTGEEAVSSMEEEEELVTGRRTLQTEVECDREETE